MPEAISTRSLEAVIDNAHYLASQMTEQTRRYGTSWHLDTHEVLVKTIEEARALVNAHGFPSSLVAVNVATQNAEAEAMEVEALAVKAKERIEHTLIMAAKDILESGIENNGEHGSEVGRKQSVRAAIEILEAYERTF